MTFAEFGTAVAARFEAGRKWSEANPVAAVFFCGVGVGIGFMGLLWLVLL